MLRSALSLMLYASVVNVSASHGIYECCQTKSLSAESSAPFLSVDLETCLEKVSQPNYFWNSSLTHRYLS